MRREAVPSEPEPESQTSAPAGAAASAPLLAGPPERTGRGWSASAARLARSASPAVGNRGVHRMLQRRLLATGDVDRFRAMAEPGSGLLLSHDPDTLEVTAVGTFGAPARSPSFAAELNRIMDDPVQDAEAHFGEHQSGVVGGAFPGDAPRDFTGGKEQRIDMDDLEKLDADAPGMGLAALAHELQENYTAHGFTPVPGVDRFEESHQSAILAENAVLADTFGPGGRVADRTAPGPGTDTTIRVLDYENYFLVLDISRSDPGNDFQITSARRVGRRPVATYVLDGYASGSAMAPGSAYSKMWAAQADLRAHPTATAWVEGFTDDTGSDEVNARISRQRAEGVRGVLMAGTGLPARSFNTVGRGETNFVADNDTDAGRRSNRRVVITIEEPDE